MACTEPRRPRRKTPERTSRQRVRIEQPLPDDFDQLPADEWDRLVRHIEVHGSISAVFKPC